MGRNKNRFMRAIKKYKAQQAQQNQQAQQQIQKPQEPEIVENPKLEQSGSGLLEDVGLENMQVDFTKDTIDKIKPTTDTIKYKDKLAKMLKVK